MSDTRWVAEEDWSKVPRGVRVQLRRPLGYIEGVNGSSDADSILITYSKTDEAGVNSRREYMDHAWSLFVEAPPIPTKPGLYRIDNGMVIEKRPNGAWVSPNGSSGALAYAEEARSFTLLEPARVTANLFAEQLRGIVTPKIVSRWYTRPTAEDILKKADALAAEFGVRS